MGVHRVTRRRGGRDALLSMLATNRIDRREFLKVMGGAGAFALLGPTLLAACAGGGDGDSLVVDNWILYIDVDDDTGDYPSVIAFEEESGLSVTYNDGAINTNEDWFAKYQPQFAAGQSIGVDVAVLTDYMAARMIRLGYVEELDKANIPNASNLADALQSPGFDPNRDYTMPWQSGFTVIGYDIDQTGRELTSLRDLLDPAFAGKVGLLEGYNDTVPFFLLMEGKDPATATVEDYVAATEPIKEAVDSGQIRQIYGNDYIDALLSGDLAVSMAWSGDIVANQEAKPSLRYTFPEEGFNLWTDNMLVPKGAANKAGAEAWMDFFYQPEIAAQVAAYVWYVTPVEGALEAVMDIDPALAEEPLIFPTPEVLANAHITRAFTEEEEEIVNEAVSAATGV
ncbi:MAG: spermidine/putrescine ABC transporter substrate-binding protein [Actinobacteria bacterium]|nr:spermidine/putrescine ABC transporter substrate-binding protein [Actinomycetota bacterium]MCI0678250.1 spermidine/putrescine ABC transporter substrate-binding protein [Actinomycetota bacterium]